MPTKLTLIKPILAFIAGLAVSGLAGTILLKDTGDNDTHTIGTSHDDEVHVHADFLFYIGDERIRLTDEEFQSTTEHLNHKSLHLHDGNDEVIHRHADDVTFVDFMQSLGFKLTNDCLIMTDQTEYCTDESKQVMLIVKGELVPDIENYIFAEADEILLYFGNPNNPRIRDYVAAVSDESCIYSGTCPERGVPPPESCGLTCDVGDLFKE